MGFKMSHVHLLICWDFFIFLKPSGVYLSFKKKFKGIFASTIIWEALYILRFGQQAIDMVFIRPTL